MHKFFIVIYFILTVPIYSDDKWLVNKETIFGLSWDSKLSDFDTKLGKHSGFICSIFGNKIVTWGNNIALEFNNDEKKVLKVHISYLFKSDTFVKENIPELIKPEQIIVGVGIKYGMEFSNVEKLFDTKDKIRKRSYEVFNFTIQHDGLFYNLLIRESDENKTPLVNGITIYKETPKIDLTKSTTFKFPINEDLNIDSKFIFGIPWESPIDMFEKKMGKAMGEFKLKDNETLYFWGNNFCLKYNSKILKVESVEFHLNSLFSDSNTILKKVAKTDCSKIKINKEVFMHQDWNEVLKILKEEPVVYDTSYVKKNKSYDGLNLFLNRGYFKVGDNISAYLLNVKIIKE